MSTPPETSGQGERLSRRFGLANLPTMSALVAPGRPVTYTRLFVGSTGHRLGDVPAESAYSLQIVRRHGIAFQLRGARRAWQSKVAAADTICLFDLQEPPAIAFDSPFETIRCYVPRSALLDLARDYRGSVDASLDLPPMGAPDPLVARLGRSLERLFDEAEDVNQWVVDYLTLTLQSHLLDAYGWTRRQGAMDSPRLSALLERRAKEAIDAQIASPRPITEMARECGLSTASFTRAFQDATGRLPHQWAMDRRMDLARARLLRSDDDIATIAATCGFSQPGNFSRAFLRWAGVGPAAWRRAKRGPGPGRPVGGRALAARGEGRMRVDIPVVTGDGHPDTPLATDVTLRLLLTASNPPRPWSASSDAFPRVMLSQEASNPSGAASAPLQRKVTLEVAPLLVAHLSLAVPPAMDMGRLSDRAGNDAFTQELMVGLVEHSGNGVREAARTVGYLAMALCARLARLDDDSASIMSTLPARPGVGLTTGQLRTVVDAVSARLDTQLSLSRLAAECGLSVSHFATAFAASMGLSPHRWIVQQRLAKAMQLLREDSLPLADVALMCGFSDQSHFTRVFAAATGLPPSRWKRARG